MLKKGYHPKAFLTRRKNVTRGLTVRSSIIAALEKEGPLNAKKLAEKVNVSYSSILHHLRLLEIEKAVVRQSGTRLWKITGVGQQRLIEV